MIAVRSVNNIVIPVGNSLHILVCDEAFRHSEEGTNHRVSTSLEVADVAYLEDGANPNSLW